MKNVFIPVLGALALVLNCAAAQEAAPELVPVAVVEDSKDEAAARSAALELAGAFSNDGYKIRDGFWYAPIEKGQDPIVEVNLFSGNEYWFCVAAVPPARKISAAVYDETGKLVDQQTYEDAARFAVGVVPAASGKYFVKVSLLEGEKSRFCLIYCYK